MTDADRVPLYDELSGDYDRFVDWNDRLAYEMPFLESQLAAFGVKRVLDVACGTGMHALALEDRGFDVIGVDASGPMIEQARKNASARGKNVAFQVAGFGELESAFDEPFEAVLCLGNSLPHVRSERDLLHTLQDFASVLVPGGLVFLQNRNLNRVMDSADRWMPLQAHREGDKEWLFFRFYDFLDDGTLAFNVATITREKSVWQQRLETTRLRPLLVDDAIAALEVAGFSQITSYGDMEGAPFDRAFSPNLILVARRSEELAST